MQESHAGGGAMKKRILLLKNKYESKGFETDEIKERNNAYLDLLKGL